MIRFFSAVFSDQKFEKITQEKPIVLPVFFPADRQAQNPLQEFLIFPAIGFFLHRQIHQRHGEIAEKIDRTESLFIPQVNFKERRNSFLLFLIFASRESNSTALFSM